MFTGGRNAECGVTEPVGPSRILTASKATKGEWPWQAIVAYKGGGQFCGGTLMAKKWVLTVSHCVNDSSAELLVARLPFSLA